MAHGSPASTQFRRSGSTAQPARGCANTPHGSTHIVLGRIPHHHQLVRRHGPLLRDVQQRGRVGLQARGGAEMGSGRAGHGGPSRRGACRQSLPRGCCSPARPLSRQRIASVQPRGSRHTPPVACHRVRRRRACVRGGASCGRPTGACRPTRPGLHLVGRELARQRGGEGWQREVVLVKELDTGCGGSNQQPRGGDGGGGTRGGWRRTLGLNTSTTYTRAGSPWLQQGANRHVPFPVAPGQTCAAWLLRPVAPCCGRWAT